jgi:hypothetical protein
VPNGARLAAGRLNTFVAPPHPQLFVAVCDQDWGHAPSFLEGIVAKRKRSTYDPALPLAVWVKIKNAEYSQARDRHELFERAWITRGVGRSVGG